MKINQLKIGTLLLSTLLGYSSCKKDEVKSQAANAGTVARANEAVSIWMTTADQSNLLKQQANKNFAADAGTNATTVTVDPNTTYQTIDGFGFTLTEGSAEVISSLSSSKQTTLLNDLFSSSGIGISVLRISIGASDMSSSDYSYQEGASFDLSGPDLTYLIPILKKIVALNPNIKILATPWTPPRWMKSNGAWIGGILNASGYSNYDQYATYFLNYLDAMKAQGISIWAITPQNEPLNPNNDPSLSMAASEELTFINNNLGPKLSGAGYTTKIICYDHNCDNTSYPTTVANGSSYVDGSAFHLYAGDISALTTVKNATNKNVYFTEQYTSSTGSFSGDLIWHIANVVVGSTRNWSRTALEWNVATNASFGPHTPGGCTTCKGAVTVSSSTSYSYNVSYYIIAHAAKFVKTGAVRISSNISGNIQNVAFKNTDGTRVLLAGNSGSSSSTFKVKWGTQSFTYTLAAGAVATFKW